MTPEQHCVCEQPLPTHLLGLLPSAHFRHICSCGRRYREEDNSFVLDGIEKPLSTEDAT